MKEQMRWGLFILFLVVALLQPVAGMGVGFSIDASEPSGGIGASFTLSPASGYSRGSGGGGGSSAPVVTQTPVQEDASLLAPNMTSPLVVTTTEGTQEDAEETKIQGPAKEEEVDNIFYIVCFGIVFMVVIVFAGICIIRKRRDM